MLTVYTKTNCSYCTLAKAFLDSNKIPYRTWNIDYSEEALEFLKAQGHKSVPQIYNGSKLVVEGGYEGLEALTQEQIDHLRGV
jgi:glutaredoxin